MRRDYTKRLYNKLQTLFLWSAHCTPSLLVLFTLLCFSNAQAATPSSSMETCLTHQLQHAADDLTVGELRAICREQPSPPQTPPGPIKRLSSAVASRLQADEDNILRPFTIMAHRQNYILLAAHNLQGYSADEYIEATGRDDISLDATETHFQLSIKTPLAVDLNDANIDIFAAYTARSFWQLYDSSDSSPFRETNHEPEVWLQLYPDYELFGLRNVVTAIGLSHQSNGKAGNLSRSWNRLYLNCIFHRGNLTFSIKPWLRISEDADNDDNPDITDYLGHGELGIAYTLDRHTFTFMSRNNLESGFSRGAVELGWSFPFFDYPYLKGYIRYFSGYGESLIDYDQYVNTIGMGIMFNDLL